MSAEDSIPCISSAELIDEAMIRKPHLRKTAAKHRLVGPVAVGSKLAGLKRKMAQAERLNGYWTQVNGKSVFVRMKRPVDASARMVRIRDQVKKKAMGR